MTDERSGDTLDALVRVEGGRILAVLARSVGDIELAEDAVQDAIVSAVEVWPRTGVPRNPGGWLYTAARRKAIDIARREGQRSLRERTAAARAEHLAPAPPSQDAVRDDQLALVFACCHPALALDAQVALTLRTVCGISTAELARVLLVSEPTMAKRLVRAKHKIADAGIPFKVPAPDQLPGRLAAASAVIHLVYTSGHAASGAQPVDHDLCNEAIRLARLLAEQVPGDPTILGLLALLLLTDARRASRLDAAGEVVALADQDRSGWDRAAIDEGVVLLQQSLVDTGGMADPYQLQAAIAACHAMAPTYQDTDWAEIVRLYGILDSVHPNPAVRLNAAVATGELHGPARSLELLDELPESVRNHLWQAARADAFERLDQSAAAAEAFRAAAAEAPSGAERRHLERRAEAAVIGGRGARSD